MKKYWGDAKPAQLEKIFLYLIGTGFKGPISWKDPSHICFDREIDSDLFVRVIFCSFGEFTSGVFSFDTGIHFCSKFAYEVDETLDLWERDRSVIEFCGEERYETLWTIDLSHLKWNAVPGRNPIWSISQIEHLNGKAQCDWIADWKAYGESYLRKISNSNDAVDMLLDIQNYKPSSWVKSDGPIGSGIYESAAILLTRLDRREDAKRILTELQNAIVETPAYPDLSNAMKIMQRRIRKLMEWSDRMNGPNIQ